MQYFSKQKDNILVSCGLDSYYSSEFLERLNYANLKNWSG
jgi:hypothetical protein